MLYVSIDIETTGLDRNHNDIIEFAAVIDDLKNPRPLEELPTFQTYVYKDNDEYHGSSYALAMHCDIFKRIANRTKGPEYNFSPVENLMYAFSNFLGKNQFPFDEEKQQFKVTPAGKNFSSFDRPFLESKVPHFADIYFNHRVLDPTVLYFDPTVDDTLPDTKTCMERAGLSGEVAHTALEDALVVVQLIRHKLLK